MDDAIDHEVIGERRHLIALAFRMLGTIAEAEDAVQETYARWYRLAPSERDAIEVPRAWLTRVASRVCLDVLCSARARREEYVGEWLPEPVPLAAFSESSTDPLDRVSLDDTVSSALLMMLESMTPAERVAFVLHDVFAVPFDEIAEAVGRTPAACRQLASSARRRIQQAPIRTVSRAEHDRVVQAFAAAAQTGRLDPLVQVLDEHAILRSDGGGFVSAARNPVFGSDKVARFVLGVMQKRSETEIAPLETPDGLGFAMWDEGRIIGVVTFEVFGGLITDVKMMLNPNKLTLWN
ncbi:MAG TPA: RNA polymerase sigma factor SigJ [Gryllotalpicola sp.]